ncbi:MAG TPA: MtrAB system histidine kinase MtrB [Nocardioidaceae bacterium]|nr:MtrAB system histidine kinase MtrB [Nocardioidaceae bacterium]
MVSSRSAVHAVGAPARWLVVGWRRSIQARVVMSVLALSAILAFLAGWVLLRQVTEGLLDSKQQAALTQAAAGIDTAQSNLDEAELSGSFDIGPVLNQLIEVLSPRDQSHVDYGVVVIGPMSAVRPQRATSWAPRSSAEIDIDRSLPADLVAKVKSQPGSWWAYSRVGFGGPTAQPTPGLVVGSQIQVTNTGQSYGLFYVFPLQEQQATLAVVVRALVAAGTILVVLLAFIAWVVTRQVVTPVRLARRIAERLAAGRLEERMHVRGEDDLARLAKSFNQMATNLQRQIYRLEELSRVQQRFVADVSHELRTPLTTVRMASEVLFEARAGFDAATQRSAELLHDQLDRFETLLTDLLEISRFDAGAASLELTEFDLRDLARQTAAAMRPVAERAGSELRLIVPAVACVLHADVRRVERIARNLISNAAQYGEGRPIDVTVRSDAESVSLLVRDRGVGLQPGEEALVFNRFWRADPARARTRGGTGLGLSIALEDTALHGGSLDAWGAPGRGSVFRCTLPRQPGHAVHPLPIALDQPGSPAELVGGPYAHYPQITSGGAR